MRFLAKALVTGLGENDQALAWLQIAEEPNVSPSHKCRPEIQFPSLRQALSAIAAAHRLPTMARRQEQPSFPSSMPNPHCMGSTLTDEIL